MTAEESYLSAGKSENRCEQCEYYRFWDSGYGNCRRYPPKEEIIYVRRGLFTQQKRLLQYPYVPWDMVACGEFYKGKKV